MSTSGAKLASIAGTAQTILFLPGDLGFKGVSGDPRGSTNAFTPTAGQIVTERCPYQYAIAPGDTLNVTTYLITGGSGATPLAGVYVGAYDALSRNLIAVSADLSSSWATAGRKDVALTAAATKDTATDVIVAFLVAQQATTNAQILRLGGGVNADLSNGRLSLGPNAMHGSANTGASTLPSTLGAITPWPWQVWAGLY